MSSLENVLKVTDLILFHASMNPPLIMRAERLVYVPKVNSLSFKIFYLHLLYSECTPGPQFLFLLFLLGYLLLLGDVLF